LRSVELRAIAAILLCFQGSTLAWLTQMSVVLSIDGLFICLLFFWHPAVDVAGKVLILKPSWIGFGLALPLRGVGLILDVEVVEQYSIQVLIEQVVSGLEFLLLFFELCVQHVVVTR